MRDLTRYYSYQQLIHEEKQHFSSIEITRDLKESGVHANDSWHYYWKRIAHVLENRTQLSDVPKYLDQISGSLGRPIRILSLGSGYCGHEIDWARKLNSPYIITCTDINDQPFNLAREIANRENLCLEFDIEDLNFIQIKPGHFDAIFAHAALHHVINLEHLFAEIAAGLSPLGIFHLVEVVGMNRKLIWDDNEKFANALLDLIPDQITRKVRLNVPRATTGMEGIRQEEILPLLRKNFCPVFELRHGAFMRFVCTHPDLGRQFDPSDVAVKPFLDFLIDCDNSAVEHGVLRPLEIWGVYHATP
jgi:SAM-dependent methyltransferase